MGVFFLVQLGGDHHEQVRPHLIDPLVLTTQIESTCFALCPQNFLVEVLILLAPWGELKGVGQARSERR